MPVLDRRHLALFTGVFAAYGFVRAVHVAWTCDDAFISFRYADNLVGGLGLVYNAGEYVEGYTNLLWTLLLAAALKLGFAPEAASQMLGLACWLGVVATLLEWSRRAGAIPLAAWLVLLSADFHTWATGGLETMLFTLLATQAVLVGLHYGSGRTGALASGSLLGLLVLTRPDGVVFAAALAITILCRHGRRALAWMLAPLVVTGLALVSFKLWYYGELLPTAFFSKSATDPYYSQGLLYVALYLAKNWYLLPALLLAGGVLLRRRDPQRAGWLLASALLFAAYVAHSGGDFMFARRLIPAVPLLFLFIEDGVARLDGVWLRAALSAALVLAALLPYPLYDAERTRIRGIADEPRFYPAAAVEARRQQAEAMGRALAGSSPRIVFEGGMCNFAYYSRLPYLVEMTGLTQYSLARLPISARGFIGHEKAPTDEWLTENHIHFIVGHEYPEVRPPEHGRQHDEIHFSNLVRARIWTYSDDIMDRLRGNPNVSFVPIEQVLAQTAAQLVHRRAAERKSALAYLDRYYFRTAGEGGRQRAAAFASLLSAGENARDDQ